MPDMLQNYEKSSNIIAKNFAKIVAYLMIF